jgi:hypothetical protein
MAISINYSTNEILVPKADTIFDEFDPITGREKRRLNVDLFWKALGDIQDDPEGAWAPTAYINTPPQDLGSFVLGRSVIILAPYFVTFEDGMYAVEIFNGNSNIQARTTVNAVQTSSANTGGLVQVTSGSGVLPADITAIAAAVWNKLSADHVAVGSIGKLLDTVQIMMDELHKIQGLDINNPMVVTPSTRTAGDITLDLTGDGSTISIVTRQ